MVQSQPEQFQLVRPVSHRFSHDHSVPSNVVDVAKCVLIRVSDHVSLSRPECHRLYSCRNHRTAQLQMSRHSYYHHVALAVAITAVSVSLFVPKPP